MEPSIQNIRGLLIDMDGTLVDHLEALTRCFQHANQQLGFPPPTRETVKRSIGGSMPVTITKFLPPEKVEEGKRLWSAHFEKIHLEGILVQRGARALLERCRANGIKAAVFTNKTGKHTRAILDNEGLLDLMEFALGAEDTDYRKPQVEFSKIAVERLGLPAEQVALVGDSPFDVQAAKVIGMASLCVTTGSHTRQELQAEGADLVFDDLEQIADWLGQDSPRSARDEPPAGR